MIRRVAGASVAGVQAPAWRRPWLCAVALLAACQAAPRLPMPTVAHVDLPRYMGDWYVIASIPTFIERDAYGAVESYQLDPDGTIATTFTFQAGSFEGARKQYRPRGYVVDPASNAAWSMQFIWPFRSDYRIAWLDAEYSRVIVARPQRDYVWIMARTPQIGEVDYQRLLDLVGRLGYDTAKVRKVPQRVLK
jgi:apolipoprotein D and lipocalin family protein